MSDSHRHQLPPMNGYIRGHAHTPLLQVHRNISVYSYLSDLLPFSAHPDQVGGLFLPLPSLDSRETRTNYRQTKGDGPTTLMQAAASMPVRRSNSHHRSHLTFCPYIICPFSRVLLLVSDSQ
ncbi:hypothetical protein V8C34DRAFT_292624 [Trichoderma compactum]